MSRASKLHEQTKVNPDQVAPQAEPQKARSVLNAAVCDLCMILKQPR